MGRTAIKETEVFQFDELDDQAKGKALDWWRTGALDYEWWDFVYEDQQIISYVRQ